MFNINDKVSAFGIEGKIESVNTNTVTVKFTNGMVEQFYIDGKKESWHVSPSLILVSRAPKIMVHPIHAFVNVYAGGILGSKLHRSRDSAIEAANRIGNVVIATVEVTGNYEG